jgi:branched-chain amino acid transport system substrate-binding protein
MTADRPITRREFLRTAGRTGLAVGLAAGLGGALGSCSDESEVSNTIATIGTTGVGASTTVATTAERGREIKIGVVSARSGPLALFGRADEWWTKYAAFVCSQGVVCGDRKLHQPVFVVEDSRSDPERAAGAAYSLIAEAQVDVVITSGNASVVNAVAEGAEMLGCPCLTGFHQWRPFVHNRDDRSQPPLRWTYAHAQGLEDIAAVYVAMWEQLPTNRKVGFVFQDDANGRLWADSDTGLPPAAESAGYECVLSAPVPAGEDDYSKCIGELVRSGCEVCCTAMPASDFITFWKRALELDFRPKIVTAGDALAFPQALEAMGPRARNLTAEGLWHPSWPYSDSLTGASAQRLAEDYMAKTGEQWIAPLAQYSKFEWAVDVFKRVVDLGNKEAVAAEVRRTKVDTCMGRIDFTLPVGAAGVAGSARPAENVCKAPVSGVQWVAGGALDFQPTTVANSGWPALPVAGEVVPLTYD